jgi:signal transduction histidine kinase
MTPVPGSPWLLMAEIDSAEALAPMRSQTRLIIAMVAGLLAATAAAVTLLRQRMQREHFRAAYESEVALRQSEAKTNAMLKAIPDLMFRLSDDGVHLDFHAPIDGQLYLDPQEFLGRRVDDVLPREVAETYRFHIRTALESGRTQDFEYHLDFPDGTRYYETRMVPCGDREVLTMVRNITDRKRAEEENRRLLAQVRQDAVELEMRVAERTAQLKEANTELETFAYSVSHDLKAPLRGIDGYSQLLAKDYADRLDDEGRLFIRNVRDCAVQMQQLIEDLLSYSRMERRDVQNISLDLPALVQAVVAERTAEMEKAGVSLHLELPSLVVRADRDGLATVLRNLLENAIKFSCGVRSPTVEIGARAEGERTVLWVRDNGIGFDMKFHDRIFEIFQRLQRTEEYPGTGIGLALVRKAMQRMGGRAWAESAPGEGATFYLEIPL